METLLKEMDLTTILLVLIVCLPWIAKGIKAIIGFFKGVQSTHEALIEEGRRQEREARETTDRFEQGEARISSLEEEESLLSQRLHQQEEMIKLLLESDQLNIKAWIKAQHDKWMPKKYIESQALDVLEARYRVYSRENGNSWAKKLMEDLRSLPVVSTIDQG